jgi:predicted DNA binding protein
MWVAKIKIDGREALLGRIARTYSVSIACHIFHTFEKENHLYSDFIAFVLGTEEDEKKVIQMLSNSPQIVSIEKQENFIIVRKKDLIFDYLVYQNNVVYMEPLIVTPEGMELFTIGAWDKENIIKFADSAEKISGTQILSVQQKKITDFALLNVQPNFSTQQRFALNLAIKNGYYDYPRKISVEQLADLGKLSYSTFQAHLRKAENKFFPASFNKS